MTTIGTTRIPGGDAGTRATLQKMRALVNRSLTDPLIVESARRLVQGLPVRDYDLYAAQVRGYLQEHLQFVPDPRGVEMLSTPRYLLTQIARGYVVQGDCDDAAILGAALAKAVGLRTKFRVLAFYRPDAPFSHVFALVQGRSGWLDLDTTRSARTAGAPVTRSMDLEV
jgi:transglutaminase-like putative cysteine protease